MAFPYLIGKRCMFDWVRAQYDYPHLCLWEVAKKFWDFTNHLQIKT